MDWLIVLGIDAAKHKIFTVLAGPRAWRGGELYFGLADAVNIVAQYDTIRLCGVGWGWSS